MNAKQSGKARTIEVEIELDATPEAVWKALTDARELENWFPLEARVEPGVGGEIWMSWGEPWVGSSPISIWEPNRHLRTTGFAPMAEEDGGAAPAASYVDYQLESKGGKTILRLVHSGFAAGTEWEDELFEGTRRGWRYELRGLRHYLRYHLGERRLVAWPRTAIKVSADEAWRRVMGAQGLLQEGNVSGLRDGERYQLQAVTGQRFEGVVLVNDPPLEFAGTVENMNQAVLGVRLNECSSHEANSGHEAGMFLSTWGVSQDKVDAFRERWLKIFRGLFPEP